MMMGFLENIDSLDKLCDIFSVSFNSLNVVRNHNYIVMVFEMVFFFCVLYNVITI